MVSLLEIQLRCVWGSFRGEVGMNSQMTLRKSCWYKLVEPMQNSH